MGCTSVGCIKTPLCINPWSKLLLHDVDRVVRNEKSHFLNPLVQSCVSPFLCE
uniref:Uncharacterized protein n=1 Tax=Rhizophora mucronata TaxID=61149 RepID=A0A2P2QBX7_RHIMU